MIKINLLSTKKVKRTITLRVGIKSNITLFFAAISVVLLLEGLAGYWLYSNLSSLTEEKRSLEIRVKEVKEKVKEVENYEKDKKIYSEKIAIIQNLKKNQKGPVRVLDELSSMLPERVWLVSLRGTGKDVTIIGSGMTNDDIVKYVYNLKSSKFFKNVQLTESRQIVDSGIPIYNFSLTFSLNLDTV